MFLQHYLNAGIENLRLIHRLIYEGLPVQQFQNDGFVMANL